MPFLFGIFGRAMPMTAENLCGTMRAPTGKHAKTSIINAWKTSPKSFAVSKKTNELKYNAGQTYEADRLMKELPETLEARKTREWVVMNLEKAKEFFGIDFK